MRGRALLPPVVAVLLAATCLASSACTARSSADPAPSATPALPAGSGALASWQLTGGYSGAGVLSLRPPRLVVYPDGQTIADAAYRTDLPAEQVIQLMDSLVADLKGPAATRRAPLASSIVDAPTTVLTVRSAAGSYTARAEGLDELREERGYPNQLYDARDRLDTLHQRVVAAGQPYTADRVRVVVEPVTGTPTSSDPPSAGAVRAWPTGLPAPPRQTTEGAGRMDLDGQQARDAVRLLDRDLDLNGAWETYRTTDGMLLRASWRYLLPDE